MALYLLYESASGYALFNAHGIDEIGQNTEEVRNSVSDLNRFGKVVQLTAFHPYESALDALNQCNSVSEGQNFLLYLYSFWVFGFEWFFFWSFVIWLYGICMLKFEWYIFACFIGTVLLFGWWEIKETKNWICKIEGKVGSHLSGPFPGFSWLLGYWFLNQYFWRYTALLFILGKKGHFLPLDFTQLFTMVCFEVGTYRPGLGYIGLWWCVNDFVSSLSEVSVWTSFHNFSCALF